MNHIVRDILGAVVVVAFLVLSFSVEALTLSAGPGTPTSSLSTYINGVDRADFSITVPLATSTTGVVAGDTLELLVNGASFPSPRTRVLTEGDIAAGSYTFPLSLTFANNLSDGVKNFTARLSNDTDGVTAQSSALTLTLDTRAPTLSPVSLASNNSDTAYATVGQVVTLYLTASESIATPTINIAGRAATVSGSGTSWTGSVTMVSADAEGSIPLSVSFADLAGNTGTTVTSVKGGGQNVIFDRTPPALSLTNVTTAASTSAGSIVGFAPTSLDAVGGSRPVSCDHASGSVFPVGTTTVSCSASDALGNTDSATFTVVVNTFVPLTTNTTVYAGAQQVVATTTTSGASTVSVPAGASTPTLNLSPLLVSESGTARATLGGALSVNAEREGDTFSLLLPSGLTITGPSAWSGVFKLPTFKDTSSVTVTPSAGNRASTGRVIEVGAEDTVFSLNKAIRLFIPRVWQEFLGFNHSNSFSPITTVCNADDQSTVDSQLGSGENCRIVVGQDVAVWTKRPGSFVVYSETPLSSVTTPAVSSGGGGGGGGSVASAPTGETVAPALLPARAANSTPQDASLIRPADIARDGVIDILDFNSLMVGWGSNDIGGTADTNEDGLVDILDFNTLMVYWGSTYQL